MPQMAPLWWTTILIMTSSMMMISITFSYFMLSNKIDIKTNLKTNKFYWKW
uniref:ATP synthase F0 subunit 8 n=1 Tax=Psammotettix sp. EMHAU-2015-Zz060503 TaxID=2036857 RepID=A0A343K1F4_9HEMI|nr:ATP synthase F0 subunit 8 [Psammotettix sp. EMHAU-2015-Zz060503]